MKRQTALVTGGGRGIGKAISLELAGCGYHVVVNYRSGQAAASETVDMIRASGGEAETACFDVTDAEAVEKAVAEIVSGSDIGVLVNNAGITADGLFVRMSKKDWDSVIDTSLAGFYNVTKPVVRQMMRRKRGSIVCISSVSGITGNRGQVNYSAAKAGIIGAGKALAAEIARLGIRVNIVAPGFIETEMTGKLPEESIKQMIPMQRMGSPGEVAKVVRFLCSEDASYITGQVISVNGGMV
ncbi:MAG: 3-oxoacyl-ACP reductase FabG [Desulfosalsimonas sp.]